MNLEERIVVCDDNNIDELRKKYTNGLHFVVGDTHGQVETLKALMKKIKFDPDKDHVFFTGDYNEGGSVQHLMQYISLYYSAEYDATGFHLIRGNHERELYPFYPLENHPVIIVVKGEKLNYYIAHAGMVRKAFCLINDDMAKNPDKKVYAYKLDNSCAEYDAPLRQVVWSRKGLYSQKSYWQNWPSEESLIQNRACIIHGHSPYCFFKREDYFSYGDNNLFWKNQHILFSEDLQSFNIDSNVKGRFKNGETYRGLACVCLEVLDEIASQNGEKLAVKEVLSAPNFVFSAEYIYGWSAYDEGNIEKITSATPEMKLITLDENGVPYIAD